MRGEPAQDQIEAGVGKGQRLCGGLLHPDVRQAAFRGRRRHGLKHAGREVAGDDLRRMRRRAIGHVTAAAAEIEHATARPRPHKLGHLVEILALGVDDAGDIILRADAILSGGEGVMGR